MRRFGQAVVDWMLFASVLMVGEVLAGAVARSRANHILENDLPNLFPFYCRLELLRASRRVLFVVAVLVLLQLLLAGYRRFRSAPRPEEGHAGGLRWHVVVAALVTWLGCRAWIHFTGSTFRSAGTTALVLLVGSVLLQLSPSSVSAGLVRSWAVRGQWLLRGVGVLAIGALIFITAGWSEQLRPRPSGPNVVMIVMDTVRKHNLSIYGYERSTTPNLERIFQDGIVYDNAFAIAPWTVPNHASIFTGLYACEHGATQEHEALPRSPVTLAETLYQAGYQTSGFSNNPHVARTNGIGQGFEDFYDMWSSAAQARFLAQEPPDGDDGAFGTNQAISWWFEERRDESRPFFLFVNYIEAHRPYEPSAAAKKEFMPSGYRESDLGGYITNYNYGACLSGEYSLTPHEMELSNALYDGEIQYLDGQIGALVDRLTASGQLENTVLIVTSDHGEFLGEHGLVGHQFGLYDEVLHVPLMIRGPELTGARRSERVMLLDLFTTVLELAGAPQPPYPGAGHSILEPTSERDLLAEYYRPTGFLSYFAKEFPDADFSSVDRRIRSIRREELKLIWGSDGRHELYDVGVDERELTDLSPSRPQVVESLAEELLRRFAACSRQPSEMPQEGPIDPELEERLRELGYLK